jgi:uncharacterized protein YecE (DUF72 family)
MEAQQTASLPKAEKTGRIFVGTCGFSYNGWAEAGFYPPGTQPGRMLALYAQRFPAAELNQTWYQMPKAEAIDRQRRQAPESFLFSAKLIRSLTHDDWPEDWRRQAAVFRHGLDPLVQSNQLAAVLVQFPTGFDRSVANRRRLATLLEELEGLPLAVEFRQGSWNNPKVFAELAKRGTTLVAVDEPDLPGLFPALDVVTNPDLFYVRFHGRNARGWRLENSKIQFDYNYWEAELREWIETRILKMADQAEKGLIFFTNHVRAQAPQNAEIFMRLLHEYDLAAVKP